VVVGEAFEVPGLVDVTVGVSVGVVVDFAEDIDNDVDCVDGDDVLDPADEEFELEDP
jgi:hypothetical protein